MDVGGNKVRIIAREAGGAGYAAPPLARRRLNDGFADFRLVRTSRSKDAAGLFHAAFSVNPQQSVAGGSASSAGSRRAAIMFRAGTCESLFDARFNVAFRLAANSCQFRNHQVTSPLQHSLLTK